jgi:hypothetical protein
LTIPAFALADWFYYCLMLFEGFITPNKYPTFLGWGCDSILAELWSGDNAAL